MGKLQEKMVRAMELKDLAKNTQRSYLTAVRGLAKHYMQSPEKMTKEMIEDYLSLSPTRGGQPFCALLNL